MGGSHLCAGGGSKKTTGRLDKLPQPHGIFIVSAGIHDALGKRNAHPVQPRHRPAMVVKQLATGIMAADGDLDVGLVKDGGHLALATIVADGPDELGALRQILRVDGSFLVDVSQMDPLQTSLEALGSFLPSRMTQMFPSPLGNEALEPGVVMLYAAVRKIFGKAQRLSNKIEDPLGLLGGGSGEKMVEDEDGRVTASHDGHRVRGGDPRRRDLGRIQEHFGIDDIPGRKRQFSSNRRASRAKNNPLGSMDTGYSIASRNKDLPIKVLSTDLGAPSHHTTQSLLIMVTDPFGQLCHHVPHHSQLATLLAIHFLQLAHRGQDVRFGGDCSGVAQKETYLGVAGHDGEEMETSAGKDRIDPEDRRTRIAREKGGDDDQTSGTGANHGPFVAMAAHHAVTTTTTTTRIPRN